MSFVSILALAIGFLVVLPYLAHRLGRRRAEDRPFAAVKLVPPAPPKARRRARLEDLPLLIARGLSVIALALLGASPFVKCSRLSLDRSGGASVAFSIVVDDSMSMRVKASGGGKTRFERAIEGARQLLASSREGDAVAIVAAGSPARVVLAATTDLASAKSAIDSLVQSDRGTDLEAALTLAQSLVERLPQVDKRIVLLSDLADGSPDGPPIGENARIAVWAPIPELRSSQASVSDCGILAADLSGRRIRVRVTCSPGSDLSGRSVVALPRAKKNEKSLAKAPVTSMNGDVSLLLTSEPPEDLIVRLEGADAISSDDEAPVLLESGPGSIAIVADAAEGLKGTGGGAPIIEQAFVALRLDMSVQPIPSVPDRSDELAPFLGILIDDPPGFTPEQRRALGKYVEDGGVVFISLGPRAASAPLGATFEPFLTRGVLWKENPVPGADTERSSSLLGDSAASLSDLGATARALLSPEDTRTLDSIVLWKDGAPLVARKSVGAEGTRRGEVWLVTLPLSVDLSDLTLRPAFLELLDAWSKVARELPSPRRSDVGTSWNFANERASITGPGGAVALSQDRVAQERAGQDRKSDSTRESRQGIAMAIANPSLVGLYQVSFDGKKELRVVAPLAREIDLRSRAAAKSTQATGVGNSQSPVSASPALAVVLLGLMAGELALRLRARSRDGIGVESSTTN